MLYRLIFQLLQKVYAEVLRPLLVKAIEDPNEVWDDVILGMIDRLFDYKA